MKDIVQVLSWIVFGKYFVHTVGMAVHIIRDIFSYADRFQGSVFVIQIDYDVIAHPSFPMVLQDLVLLHQIGIRVVLVPGARSHIDEILQRYGIDCPKVNGVRVSSAEAIPFIKMAAFDAANRVMTLLSRHRVTGIIGNWVRSRGLGVIDGVDYEESGKVDAISIDLISSVLDDGLVPIFPCIGWSLIGRPYNISSVELAAQLSIDLKAAKLFYLTSMGELKAGEYKVTADTHVDGEGRISRLHPEQAEALIADNPDCDQYVKSVLGCSVQACRGGVDRAHIVDGRRNGVILEEVFTNQGVGTMVHFSPFESLRPMEASDAPAMIRIMQAAMDKGVLVQRSVEDLLQKQDDWVVCAADDHIVGCGALHEWGEGSAEVAGLAADCEKGGNKAGDRVLKYLIDRAMQRGLDSVFVLTTQAADWFAQHGFSEATVEDLPAARQAVYNPQRRSRVLMRRLKK